tara:strand:- start:384 stop:755 length:372 start_codon:yes stop_codon:yes gene_type:complete
MSKYIADNNNPTGSQVPGPLPDNAYDRTSRPARCAFTKTPNYVLITKTMTKPFGFFYGSSASFSTGQTGAGESMNSSSHYDVDWGLQTVGTRLDIHPTAWSGSSDDDNSILFVYRSGLSTGGR